jgi:ribose transport system permease protein
MVLLVIFIASSIFSPHFRRVENLVNIFAQSVPLGLVSFGQTIVLLTAGVDLSVGGLMSIGTVLCAVLIHSNYIAVIFAMLGTITIGIGFGYINGFCRAKLGMPSFIATLCTMLIAQGIALAILPRPGGYISAHLMKFIGFESGPFRLPLVYFFLILGILYVLLKYYPLGRYFYAVGGNIEAAKASGLNVDSIIFKAHILCSFFGSLAGIFLVARINSGDPNVGSPFILDSIIASLIGGTTFAGGSGGIIGTFAGVLILGIIGNVLNMYSVNPFYQYIIKGLMFVAAVFVYSYRRKR